LFGGDKEANLTAKRTLLTDAKDFSDGLVASEATLRPILGDMALVATGKTTQNVTANTTAYSFDKFSANFKNIFQPNITVKIGEKELKDIVQEEVPEALRAV